MRIGIVNDLPAATDVLLRVVALKPEYHVIWTAKTSGQAVNLCMSDPPDVVLMDLFRTDSEGVDATRQIMSHAPCAILIVTGSVRIHAARVFEAMGHGALDAVDMPQPDDGDFKEIAAPVLGKLATISQLIRQRGTITSAPVSTEVVAPTGVICPLIAIGASAGGPAAVAVVLRALPTDLPASVVIIQHVQAEFAAGMADWLSRESGFLVHVAAEGERLAKGKVLIAGTSDHLVLKSASRLGYTAEPRDYHYRPSVDVFFQSVNRLWRGPAIGVLMTGMGSDGALGLKALRDRGCHTIAQDRASSVVYGMPKAAAAIAAAVEILPADRIGPRLMDLVAARFSGSPG